MDFKTGIYDSSGSGITGSSDLTLKIKRDADDQFFDFNDSAFKAAGHTTIAATITEIDAVNVPGEYEYNVDPLLWDDGWYTFYITYAGTNPWTDSNEFYLIDGKTATPIDGDIVDDTAELQSDLADGGRLDVLIDALPTLTEMHDGVIEGTVTLKQALAYLLITDSIFDSSRVGGTFSYKDSTGAVKIIKVMTNDDVDTTVS